MRVIWVQIFYFFKEMKLTYNWFNNTLSTSAKVKSLKLIIYVYKLLVVCFVTKIISEFKLLKENLDKISNQVISDFIIQ